MDVEPHPRTRRQSGPDGRIIVGDDVPGRMRQPHDEPVERLANGATLGPTVEALEPGAAMALPGAHVAAAPLASEGEAVNEPAPGTNRGRQGAGEVLRAGVGVEVVDDDGFVCGRQSTEQQLVQQGGMAPEPLGASADS
jgi:hypothetical protein